MIKSLILGFIFSLSAFADNSNTGVVGVVCFKNSMITSVEVLDLFEARSKGLVIKKDITQQFEVEAQKMFAKILKDVGESHKEAHNLTYVKASLRPILPDAKLELVQDNYPLLLPKGCEIQQITLVQNERTTWIDTFLYNQLDNANKLAVIFHDYLYWQETKNGVTDSRYTRVIVGWAFSTSDPFESTFQIMGNLLNMAFSVYCMSKDERLMFAAKKESMFGNKWKFHIMSLNGHQIFSKKTGVFEIAYDLKEAPAGASIVSKSVLRSKINPNETMTVKSSSKGLFVSWKGTDPMDEFKDLPVECKAIDLRGL